MPEYLTPGVYMEEFEIGARPIEGVSTSTTGFLGMTERGPVIPPRLVTSWDQFLLIYGGHVPDSYLAYAIEGFFGNGGQRCYIGRVVRTGAETSNSPFDTVKIKAVGAGSWGNYVGIRIDDASDPQDNKFKMTVAYWRKNRKPKDEDLAYKADKEERNRKIREILETADLVESFDNLSPDENKPTDYYMKKLGDPLNNLSNLILFDEGSSGRPANTEDTLFKFLEKGLDAPNSPPDPVPSPIRIDFLGNPKAKPGEKRGLTAFEDIDEISILNVPDIYYAAGADQKTIIDDVLTHCERLKDRFAIIDTNVGQSNVDTLTINNVAGRPSKYGAIYYPWIKVYDPLTQQLQKRPPGGHVAGIYARSDNERGVHKAPANETVRGARELEFTLTKGEQGILNPRGINVIRSFKERGIMVWGARNAILDALWKYVNVRRLFIFVEESIEKGTQWVVFEPNDEKLWARVRATITQFLTKVWRDGALMGKKPEEAFFVKCDRTTMTQDDIDNGRLICIIGIAPVKPAEFVIFRIAQWQGGSAATE